MIALAIPFFFLLIGLELLLTHRIQGRREYRLADAVTDLSCGVGQQALGVFVSIALFFGYDFVATNWSFAAFAPSDPLAWIIAFVGVDFLYYWWHRLSHEVNILWAVHVVHHHSQDYNLAVALRQAWFSGVTSWVFYLPLAFVGVPAAVFFSMVALSTLYQFWIHTRAVRRCGVVEGILNTPSAHRVHHGINPRYIDRNHGAILIVWDRLFGTYEPEGEEVVYGVVTPHQSWNPLWANFEYFAKILRMAKDAPRAFDKLAVWWKAPGWKPRGLGAHEVPPPVDAKSFVKWDTPCPAALGWYVVLQYLPVVVATFCVLWFSEVLGAPSQVALVALLLFSTFVFGALLEGRAFAPAAEVCRQFAIAAVALWFVGARAGELPLGIAIAGVCAVSAVAFWRVNSSVRVEHRAAPSQESTVV